MTPEYIQNELDKAFRRYGTEIRVSRYVAPVSVNAFGEGIGSPEEPFEVLGLVSLDKDENVDMQTQLAEPLDYDGTVTMRYAELIEKSGVDGLECLTKKDTLHFFGANWRIVSIRRTGQVGGTTYVYKCYVKNEFDGYPV